MTYMVEKNRYWCLVGKPEGNRDGRWSLLRWKAGCGLGLCAWDRNQWWAVVNTVMNFGFYKMRAISGLSEVTLIISGGTLPLHARSRIIIFVRLKEKRQGDNNNNNNIFINCNWVVAGRRTFRILTSSQQSGI